MLFPIILDIEGDSLTFSSADEGVVFDIDADGELDQVAWTLAGEDDSWLAIDRNRNGLIDDGSELFGTAVDPATGDEKIGFGALSLLDTSGNGWIDAEDAQFGELLLWQDANHDGRSTPLEVASLSEAGVTAISLDYKSSMRTDANGNRLRFRAKVESTTRTGVYAYDVYLLVDSTSPKPLDIGSIQQASCTTWACRVTCSCGGRTATKTGGASTESQACINAMNKAADALAPCTPVSCGDCTCFSSV
jgi:hypothetical protein